MNEQDYKRMCTKNQRTDSSNLNKRTVRAAAAEGRHQGPTPAPRRGSHASQVPRRFKQPTGRLLRAVEKSFFTKTIYVEPPRVAGHVPRDS